MTLEYATTITLVAVEIWWVLSDSNREDTKITDLQSAPDTITGLSTHDISFADALFAMLNGINCSSYRLST